MFSYQHEFHAGNHADCLKHTVLSAILDSLTKKEKPFTVIDSHASAGRFRTDDERLEKTGEAKSGIYRLIEYSKLNPNMPDSIKRYLELELPYIKNNLYAGSPEISRILLRNQDHLHLVEKHPQALASLKNNVQLPIITQTGEEKSKTKANIREEDSYHALEALTPPLVKRGLVLIDPSYEDASDYKKVEEAIKTVRRKWNTAIIALWYPLLLRRKNETAQLLSGVEDFSKLGLNPCESFRTELKVYPPESMSQEDKAHLYGSGMLIINPPWKLKETLEEVITYFENAFSEKVFSENAFA